MIQGLDKQEIDIAGVHQVPSVVLKKLSSTARPFTDYDINTNKLGSAPWYVPLSFAEKHPDVVKRFVKVVAKTNAYMNAHPDEAIKIYADYKQTDPSKISINYFAEDGLIQEDTVESWNEILADFGLIKEKVPLNKLYTNKYNPNYKSGI